MDLTPINAGVRQACKGHGRLHSRRNIYAKRLAMLNTILVAVDGSNHAKNAVKTAAELAGKLDATLLLVTIDEPGSLKGEVANFATTEGLDRMAVAEWILHSAEAAAEEAGARTVRHDIEGGAPAEAILRAAQAHQVEMIVMGARGLSELQGLVFGSVSHKVLHMTNLPVLIVRE